MSNSMEDKETQKEGWWKPLDRLAYLVIELWELSFHFVPLEEMIFRLLTHWWNQIKLPGHGVPFLGEHKRQTKQ